MFARLRAWWQSVLDHPIVWMERRRVQRKRWRPGRRFFLFYPVLLGAALGCGITLALGDVLHGQVAALAAAVPSICVVNVVAWLLGFGLAWVTPAFTAISVARERELGTLDLLRATLLTERSIVLGKLGGYIIRLWPALLLLLLLTPFRLAWSVVGGGFFGVVPYLLVPLDWGPDMGRWFWVWFALMTLAEWLRPWGDLALHAAIGLFASAVSRTSGLAVAISYGMILAARGILYVGTSLLVMPLLWAPVLGMSGSSLDYGLGVTVWSSVLASLLTVGIEVTGAVLLVQGAIEWLRRS